MKVKISELKTMVQDMILEAGKAKKAKKAKSVINPPEATPRPTQYKYDEAFDMSAPKGADNLYRGQGQAAWGPQTSAHGESINAMETRATRPYGYSEAREFFEDVVSEGPNSVSVWDNLVEKKESEPHGVWETLERLSEKHLGFKKLKGKLSHEKGVKDPGALAASIGRKKFGAAGMAKKAAAGKK